MGVKKQMKNTNSNISRMAVIAVWALFAGCFLLLSSASGRTGSSASVSLASGPGEIYTANCAKCHGADGRAKTAKGRRAGATDFTSDWNRDQARGIRIITNGKGEMPSFKGKLSPQDIRSVFGYVSRFGK
jgi:cytochrome c6